MELVKYNAMCAAIAEARSVDEVVLMRDKAAAIAAAAKISKNREPEIYASEIRIRAERRLGEMIREQKETVGLNAGAMGSVVTGSDRVPLKDTRPTLADVGIDKKLSSRAQAIASIPEDDFEQTLAEHRAEQQAVTAATMERLAKKAHVANNSGNNEWYTPLAYINAAIEVMGEINCDPASSEIANKTVCADVYFTEEQNGLVQKWHGNVWMNPPYAQPQIREFCEAVSDKYDDGEIKQAVVLVNNATETAFFHRMTQSASAVCFPKGRVRFLDPDGNPGAPLQGQAIIYFGKNITGFFGAFSGFGFVAQFLREDID